MDITTETRTLIESALAGDPALASLAVSGQTLKTLVATIAPGFPANAIGGATYGPRPPFQRETLIELILRMQRIRWRRFNSTTRILVPPTNDDLLALHSRHVRATVGFECFHGWADLLDALFTWLTEIAPQADWQPVQIKEKFASLRFYWTGNLPHLAQQAIEAAEHVSGYVCEVCGGPGVLQSDGGWMTTRCRLHAD
jgi:hypothetical protein